MLPWNSAKPTDGVGVVAVRDLDEGTMEMAFSMELFRENAMSISLESSLCKIAKELRDWV